MPKDKCAVCKDKLDVTDLKSYELRGNYCMECNVQASANSRKNSVKIDEPLNRKKTEPKLWINI